MYGYPEAGLADDEKISEVDGKPRLGIVELIQDVGDWDVCYGSGECKDDGFSSNVRIGYGLEDDEDSLCYVR
ncbi:hypothetical protein VCRA2126O85_50189 [Vibrio crassostreae]|nr:hypothetical protein VCRA2125O83_50190 [Vibrio crassostreae]CAK3041567.1 hypothetical protein VCRA2126O86_50189 [Vibrio crassostreae]CAK3042026.1 hypothetical protein VCRA2128O106_50189 [Vibrio crassostreae]CAK3044288.1 hypothetical protein VCRA2126O85_50189 [Vibrio crassostreae]CAK3044389.1 hypothetical protein VCRA2127O91_50190 [Vibrio crassostreae]